MLLSLVLNSGLMLLAATFLTEVRQLRTMVTQQPRTVRTQLVLGAIFGILSITCTYTGFKFQGAVVNTRVISTTAAGLIGGPISGITAGLLSGLHRYFYDPSGFTSLACGIGTFAFGVIGAAFYKSFSRSRRRWLSIVLITILAEIVQCAILLTFSKPFEAAVALEKVILLPKIIINSIGFVLFMWLFDRLNRNLTIELAEQQVLSLLIAQKCLPYLRRGIGNYEGLQEAVDIVRKSLPEYRVAITDCSGVLVGSGIKSEPDRLPEPAARAIKTGKLVIADDLEGVPGFEMPEDSALIASPLLWDEEVIGTLLLISPTGANKILDADVNFAKALSQLFAATLELGELQHQVDLRRQAEFRALQAQINPHFLFNALNTISALCVTNPDRARETILVLASYLRQTLTLNEQYVTLEQEMSNVDNYLLLSQARFEEALHVTKELPSDLTRLRLPPLILQPIVENAINHGFISSDDRHVAIRITQDDKNAYIEVSDKGSGFSEEVIEKLFDPDDGSYTGLFNVLKRLRSLYRNQFKFDVKSSPEGSTVHLTLPLDPPKSDN